MNKKKSKALAFLLAASLLVPSVNGIVSAAELDNVKSANKVVASQEATNPDGSDTSTQDPVTQNVAKIWDKEYATLESAINAAGEGATITLLGNVTEDITVNKNITIDGQRKYRITGLTTLKNGTLQNIIIQPNPDNAKGSVLVIGNTDQTNIKMERVTVNYSVTKRDAGSAVTVSGNKANITIQNCLFTNHPNNAGKTVDAPEWSYGLFINGQANEGSILFDNNRFEGAFRTMLPNITGNITISNNTFVNSVETVLDGPTSGAGAECTCITTDVKSENDSLIVTNNTFDNAGAFYFQTLGNVNKNTFKGETFPHYIQLRGIAEGNLDLKDNTFEMGNNAVCTVDTANRSVLLPVDLKAVSYWSWAETDASIKPVDYTSYVYKYNADGSKTFYPESVAALQAFIDPKNGNIGVGKGEKVVVSKDMTIGDNITLDVKTDMTIEVPSNIQLNLNGSNAMNVSAKLNLEGAGNVNIGTKGVVTVSDNGNLESNTTINNDGTVVVDKGSNGSISGNPIGGNVYYKYPSYPSYPSKPTYTHEEIIGSDRYETAAKIADKLGSYDNIVLVNAESSMSDGLAASGLAGKENGAILLTKKDSIPKATMDRIKKVKKVYIIGGEAAISQKVYDEITAAGIKVERLGGKDRVETSEIVAKKLGNYSDAFVVNGFKGEADAMSASAIAAKKGAPILLTNGKTSTHAKKSGVEYYVIGGDNVVDKSIADKYNAEVLAGKDRYATNKEVINEFYSGSDKVYIANGDKLVDALTASPLAEKDGIVLVNEKSDKSILKGKNTVQVGGMDFEIEFEK